MRKRILFISACAALMGCDRHPQSNPPQKAAPAAEGDPRPAASGGAITGTLLERIDASSYSYLRIRRGQEEIWAAVPQAKVEKGAAVTVVNATAMGGFESTTLKRKFDMIYFGTLGATPSEAAAMPTQHALAGKAPDGASVIEVKVEKASGPEARTVLEIYQQKEPLKGKTVVLRATVVKATLQVMGRNWLHLRDGSGDASNRTHDITATTREAVPVGAVVTLRGAVHLNKDFGAGYSYPVIIEDAEVIKP